MKPFDLERALAGEPVVGQDNKFFVIGDMSAIGKPDDYVCYYPHTDNLLQLSFGYLIGCCHMWQEPRPKVRIGEREINAPLKPSEIIDSPNVVHLVRNKCVIDQYRMCDERVALRYEATKAIAFATKEDAEAFIDAMHALVEDGDNA